MYSRVHVYSYVKKFKKKTILFYFFSTAKQAKIRKTQNHEPDQICMSVYL